MIYNVQAAHASFASYGLQRSMLDAADDRGGGGEGLCDRAGDFIIRRQHLIRTRCCGVAGFSKTRGAVRSVLKTFAAFAKFVKTALRGIRDSVNILVLVCRFVTYFLMNCSRNSTWTIAKCAVVWHLVTNKLGFQLKHSSCDS